MIPIAKPDISMIPVVDYFCRELADNSRRNKQTIPVGIRGIPMIPVVPCVNGTGINGIAHQSGMHRNH